MPMYLFPVQFFTPNVCEMHGNTHVDTIKLLLFINKTIEIIHQL